jgi:glycosyltransferase involved in cell wall biosynthesis
MKFSLIVSTIGRDRDLRLLLASLAAQTRQDFEVLVVDQSQGATIADLVAEYSGRLIIRHLPMDARGVSRGRNFGWMHAQGDILNFPDDDCTWPPDLLAEVEARLNARPALDALITRVETVTRMDPHGGPVTRHNIFRRSVEFALFVRRHQMGGLRFDEQMGPGAGTPWGADEGPDLMLRMLGRGLTIEYFPELCMFHPNPLAMPPESLLSRTLAYSRGRGYVLRKYRFSPFLVVYTLLRSLGGALLMLCRGRWVNARLYWLAFCGQLFGYLGIAGAEAQCTVLRGASAEKAAMTEKPLAS